MIGPVLRYVRKRANRHRSKASQLDPAASRGRHHTRASVRLPNALRSPTPTRAGDCSK